MANDSRGAKYWLNGNPVVIDNAHNTFGGKYWLNGGMAIYDTTTTSAVGKSTQDIWNVRAVVGLSRQELWKVRTLSGKTAQLLWNVIALTSIVSKILSLKWNVKYFPVIDLAGDAPDIDKVTIPWQIFVNTSGGVRPWDIFVRVVPGRRLIIPNDKLKTVMDNITNILSTNVESTLPPVVPELLV